MTITYQLRDGKRGKEFASILYDLGLPVVLKNARPKYPGGCCLWVSESCSTEVELLMKMCNLSYE